MPKGTTLKETVETRSYDKQFFFMGKFLELLGSPTYHIISGFIFKSKYFYFIVIIRVVKII
jgi:hypothetical protein